MISLDQHGRRTGSSPRLKADIDPRIADKTPQQVPEVPLQEVPLGGIHSERGIERFRRLLPVFINLLVFRIDPSQAGPVKDNRPVLLLACEVDPLSYTERPQDANLIAKIEPDSIERPGCSAWNSQLQPHDEPGQHQAAQPADHDRSLCGGKQAPVPLKLVNPSCAVQQQPLCGSPQASSRPKSGSQAVGNTDGEQGPHQ